MATIVRGLVLLALWAVTSGCEDGERSPVEDTPDAAAAPLPWFGRTRGGAVVLSRDERIAVVVSRSTGIVTVYTLDPGAALDALVTTERTELDLGAGTEPWAAVIGRDGDTAYVISRQAQTVTRIVDLRGTPKLDGALSVGSEPTSIVISPTGCRLFVANWGNGTISVVPTPECTNESDFIKQDLVTIDLNPALVSTGVLGDVSPRRGLAHPRALALSDDGDELDDETLYATEFFSMPRPEAEVSDGPGYVFDRNRQGFVYPIPLSTREPGAPIPIAPIADTGFLDSDGEVTGCFPNQLYAAAVSGNRLFVTSMCASPAGPLGPSKAMTPENFKTVMHSAVFVIDTDVQQELPDQRQLLTQELEQRYVADAVEHMRMPLIPNDLDFTGPLDSDSHARTGCMTALGADAVFCARYDEDGRLQDLGLPSWRDRRFIDLRTQLGQSAARLPVGIAISPTRGYALVASETTQSLSVLDLEAGTMPRLVGPLEGERAAEILDSPLTEGRALFATGLDAWSFKGEARVSCEGCHPDGLSDGVTWFFPRGPRRTISTAGSYDPDGQRRVMLWTGNIDEIHDVEVIVRSVAGGAGAILWDYARPATNAHRLVYDGNPMAAGKHTSMLHNNLNGSIKRLLEPLPGGASCSEEDASCDHGAAEDWDDIDAFIASVRAPRAPTISEAEQAQRARGAELFRTGRCAGCHGGPAWTLSRVFYTPGREENGELPFSAPPDGVITDAQLGRLRTQTYSVPEPYRSLNPPGVSGTATLRLFDPPIGRDRVEHLYGTDDPDDPDDYNSAVTHRRDQINCVLRAVGTFPVQPAPPEVNSEGIVPAGSTSPVRELRQDMQDKSLADGKSGFNIPSLVGVAAGAPYFHAGNARTLEELFDPTFAGHYRALAPKDFLDESDPVGRSAQIDDLVAFLLAIGDTTMVEEPEPADDLCVRAANAAP